ncbi:hexosaminidase [Nocardioides terrae]|uniref:beta-N-acetylhexosaminidase n=1 Tax=Nocardioides terrae TaxID=574651 RepID=A0A1I1D7U1_9ACTN|nr:beta-N-acetylhexosaminidase [Nocardioides terrae]SFB70877.1 hexosaminidase [Nocardioides terrae]
MLGHRRTTSVIVSTLAVAASYAVGLSPAHAGPAAPTAAAAHHSAAAAARARTTPQVVPRPARMRVGKGRFTVTRHTRIAVRQHGAARAVAVDLARDLRPATGFRLPVVSGHGRSADIRLRLGHVPGLTRSQRAEGYRLDVRRGGVRLTAPTAHGLFDGVQTIRQLLPASIASRTRTVGPWTIPVVHIVDHPRYAYRGFMLDIARHFQTPETVMSLIDEASAYKINTLHLHVSDDQGFRIVIDGFPNLTAIGSQGSVGTQGRTMDPGGFWTQRDYRRVVAHAAAHFMKVVPEVDSPGHNNAIIMSEYGDTANPLLDGHPQDINCSRNDPPQWNFTGDVGYSAMCPESENTLTIYDAIVSQLSAMSSSRYYHLGGDEVPASTLSHDRYAAFINEEAPLVTARGKTVMGWAEIAGAGTTLPPGSVAEYWNPASGTSPDTITAHEAVAKDLKIVMAPATHAYLDQKYAPGVPADLGLSWACNTGCDVDQFYNWDPGTYVTGVTDQDVIGVEGAMWAETVHDLSEVQYMVFPRLIALAEVGWTPQAARSYADFLPRLGAQGPRLTLAGTSFYPTPLVPWAD